MRNYLIIDNETMGIDDHAHILSVGALMITEEDLGKTAEELLLNNTRTWKLDGKEQRQYKRTVNKQTVAWWKEQGEEARRVLAPADHDVTMGTFLDELAEWVAEMGYKRGQSWLEGTILQRGTIDFPQLASISRDIHGDEEWLYNHLHWHKIRDIRSIIDTLNLGAYDAVNKWSVPCEEAVEEYTEGQYNLWWDYLDRFKEDHGLVAHDAASDCIIQYESLKVMGLFGESQ